ncbi:MAG: hypothetical protein HY809_05690 [Nitrospirae bacterium]|nr:hypothetical protein [Nitrospirota bacterium]
MKPLILLAIASAAGLLSLIITRTYKKNRAIILFFAADIILLTVVYYYLIYLYHIVSYLALLFLFVFILSVMRATPRSRSFSLKDEEMLPENRRAVRSSLYEWLDTFIKYASFGHLALASILVSVFLLPEVYHSIPIVAGVGIVFFSLLNLNLIRKRKNLPAFDRLFIYVLYVKVIALALSLNPFFVLRYPYALPLSSLLASSAGFGVLLRGELFVFRVRASADMLWKTLLLISLIIYGVILVYLDRYSTQELFLFYVRIVLVSGFIIISGTLLFSRAARHRVKFFLLRNLYVSKYNLHEILTHIFSLQQKSSDSINYFIKEVLNYLFEGYPFSGILFMFKAGDEKIEERIGDTEEKMLPLVFSDEAGPARISIAYYGKEVFDEDDRLNLKLISDLVFRMASDMYLNRTRIFREKLEIAERLKLFLIHDLKNICHTLNMLQKNISRVQPSEVDEFMADFRLTVPHIVKRAEKILNTIGILREGNNPAVFSLKEVVEEILSIFHKKHLFEMRFEGDDRVYADKATVMIAVENILRNAHDKSFENTDMKINIEGRRVDENYVLSICDNGPPINEEFKARIFEPFFTTKKGGIGIGLYQAKEFIESQKGSILVDNLPGGVCFIVKLPAGQYHLFK